MRATNRLLTICLCGASLLAVSAAYAADNTSDIGTVQVTGAGTELGSGNMVVETAGKERSTVTNAGIQNLMPTSNPFQDMNLLPGVAQEQQDATGLFGGNITVRGLRADQLGFTINGAPVNDSGNYAVYPQEYADTENLDQIFITQGSTDVDSPHVGASGGNISIVTRAPSDKFNTLLEDTFGDDNLQREFTRIDTGWVGPVKAFASYSHAEANKWKGAGGTKRDHIDAQLFWKIANASSASFNVLYNTAIIDFINSESLAQFKTLGAKLDYNTTLTGNSATDTSYYKYHVNPFKNAVVNAKVNLQLADHVRFDFEPYYWYGWGGGSTAVNATEGAAVNSGYTTPYGYYYGDLNGDGTVNSSTKVDLYRSSVTRTRRPGFNTKLTYDIANWTLQLGGWYEKANHRQTQPFSTVTNGTVCDIWLTQTDNNPCIVKDKNTGKVIQGRDQLTVSQGSSLWVAANGRFFNDALKLNLGLKQAQLDRDGHGYLPIAVLTPGNPNYNVAAVTPHLTYSELLPNVNASYDFSDEHQVFADLAKNFKAPQNYVLFQYNFTGTTFFPTNYSYAPETSWSYEMGYRYHGPVVNASVTGFFNDFKNYQATAYLDPTDPTTLADVNIGGVHMYGVDAEAGTTPWHGFTFYASGEYLNTELQNNFATAINPATGGTPGSGAGQSVNVTLPTAGKQLPDAPHLTFGTSVGYQEDGFFASISPKYTGARKSTLMNDEAIPGYWTTDFSAGYTFKEGYGAVQDLRVQFFVTNLFDKNYLGAISTTSGLNSQTENTIEINPATHLPYAKLASGTVFYYSGAPRFFGIRLAADLH